MAKAINGLQKGKKPESLPLGHTSWQDWSSKHPDSLVLSTSTGYKRDYSKSPYSGYQNCDQIFFPVSASDERFHKKEWVPGIPSIRIQKYFVLPDFDGLPVTARGV